MVDQNQKYLFRKRGVFYFSRRVPQLLKNHFDRDRIVVCLGTNDRKTASTAARRLADDLETVWARMRLNALGIIQEQPGNAATTKTASNRTTVRLSEAHDLYVRLKGTKKGNAFQRYTSRNINYAISSIGDIHIPDIQRAHAIKFRDDLIAKGMSTASVKRVFATVRATIGLAISEYGLDCQNALKGVFMPEVGTMRTRPPIPVLVIGAIQRECMMINDERRLLIALLSDTGMRLAEALGLIRTDFHLEQTVPYVEIKPHNWRDLKTPSSIRDIPLIGASLEASRRLCKASNTFIFPSYANKVSINSNSASAALGKWLKRRLPAGCVVHSFRHSLRDRLRSIECPADIVDAIGGWTTKGIGHRYGIGYSIEIKHRWLRTIAINDQ